MALIGATVHLNQQRKSSSFGKSSVSQKHPTTRVCLSMVEILTVKSVTFVLAVNCLKLLSLNTVI